MIRPLFVVISFVLLVLGLFILFRSVTWGIEAANAYLSSLGGGMDTAQFTIVLQEHISTYRWIGGILSILGGFGLVRAIEFQPRN